MNRILVVSNRLPVNITKRDNKLQFSQSSGGLATGMSALQKTYEMIWVGWPGITKYTQNEKKEIVDQLNKQSLVPVFLSRKQVELYYENFSNRTIWPLFHYFTQYTHYNETTWEAYREVNKLFARKVIEQYREGDFIWIHDYHLMLVPEMIRQKKPNASIGYFLHIPFPSFEIFRYLPWRDSVLKGILGADLVGFHTFDYARHFSSSIMRLQGLEHYLGQVFYDDRMVRIDTFPMGIDFIKYAEAPTKKQVKKQVKYYHEICKDSRIIISIDRLDYSKGILQRLDAFHQLLHDVPSLKEKVTLILLVVPSRDKVDSYQQLKQEVDEFVGRINGEHGTISWSPVKYFYRSLPSDSVSALYSVADVCLVTPFRDGMNLVAKEFIASKEKGDGVLILSEMAGSVNELSEAIIINPNDIQDIVDALRQALEMPEDEQQNRIQPMRDRLQRYDIYKWAEDFVDRLVNVKSNQDQSRVKLLRPEIRDRMVRDYKNKKKRLILLDYDGTLVPFVPKPSQAKPDRELLDILKSFKHQKDTRVILISGRDKETLTDWMHNLDIDLIAEHGAWIRERGGDWYTLEPHAQDWKDEIRQILESYVDRTPGAFIEEKTFSMVWHYRRSSIGLGEVRARELAETLGYFTLNMNLQILEGNKVIEIKNAGINKGRAAMHFLERENWDFVLAIGDDWTDEDTFKALPEFAYSIKVGFGTTVARHNVNSYNEVRDILRQLTGRSYDETNH